LRREEPTATGYAPSREEAADAAREAAGPGATQGYVRSAERYLSKRGDERRADAERVWRRECPGWSVGSIGRSRWFWLVWGAPGDFCRDAAQPIASGYAPTKPEAEAAAVVAAGPGACQLDAKFATHHHRRLCVAARAARRTTESGAEAVELL